MKLRSLIPLAAGRVAFVPLEYGACSSTSAAELPDSFGAFRHVQPAFDRAACLPWAGRRDIVSLAICIFAGGCQ